MPSQKETDFERSLGLLFACSPEKFIELYRKYDETIRGQFYSKLSTKIVNNIVKSDDVNKLKQHLKLIELIREFEDAEVWDGFNKIEDKSLKNSNYIVLASKYNREKVLKYLLENTNIVANSSSDTVGGFQPEDRDDENHNAFYYAIRADNCQIIEVLLDFWSSQCRKNPDEVYELFAQTYEELKLKNVVLSDKIVTFVEKKLIDYRFYSDNSEKLRIIKISHSDIKARIELMVESINLLTLEYSQTNKLDEKFFLRGRFIVQNLNILKRQMKLTYSKLPWEEVEFCLVAYINVKQRSEKIKMPIFNFFLNKNKLFYYLDIFAKKLDHEKMKVHEIPIKQLSNLPKCPREKAIDDIINANPEFEELYNDYRLLRDTYSLTIIKEYLDLSLLADASEQEGQLVITRTLQVIGEYIKNTWESPKMSEFTSQLLISSLPPNTRGIIIDLRNSLSHTNPLLKRLNVENASANSNFFANIQNETKIINTVIKNVLHQTQVHHTVELLETVASSQTADDIKNTLETFDFVINSVWFEDKLKFQEDDSLEKSIAELESIISNKTPDDYLFLKLKQASKYFNSLTNQFDYKMKLILLKEMRRRIDDNVTENNIRDIKYKAYRTLLMFNPNVDFKSCKETISLLLFQILGSFDKSKISSEDLGRLPQIVNTIFTQVGFGIHNMKWLEELRDKVYENNYLFNKNQKNDSKGNDSSSNKTKVKEEYTVKLSTLKNIIENNQLDKDVSAYRKNKKLQAVIEMLVLDIMSILESSKNILVDNHLLLDKSAPLLVGKNLRNHLAHGNAFLDILLFDSSVAIFLNAAKFTTENVIESNKKVGKVIQNNLTELKKKYDVDLMNIINQKAMFESLERGDFDAFKDTLSRGAEINSRNYRLCTALHFAAKGSNCETIKFILDKKVNVNAKDVNGRSPLHIAAEYGRTDVVKLLVSKKFLNTDVVDDYQETALHVAAQRGHKEIVEFLLKNNSNTKGINLFGYTPLHCAALNGHKDVVKVLLKEEISVDHSKSFDGMTVLHFLAAKHGHADLIKYLVTLKANVNTMTQRNEVPLHEASLNGHLEVVKILIANKADINVPSVDGLTPLHNAVETNREEVTEILLQNGAAINAVYDPDNYAAINHAAKYGHVNILKLLLKYNAEVNIATNRKMTPLHFGALHSTIEIVDLLIKNKARLNVKDIEGLTPLHFACIKGKSEIAKLLLNSGASLDVKDKRKQTPLHLAAFYGKIEVVKVLIDEGANCYAKDADKDTALSLSSLNGHADVVKLLINQKVDINTKNSRGITPLYQASFNGHEKIVQILKEAGADINITDSRGRSALHASAFRGHIKVVEYLIDSNVKIDIVVDDDMSPLHVATENNHYKIVEKLIQKYPINLQDKKGRTPLMIASSLNYVEIVKLLINHGADVKVGSMQPIVVAVASGNKGIVDVLINHKSINVNDLIPGLRMNLLHLAVISNHNHIVETLIAKKIDVNAKCLNGPPIILAAEKGYADIVDTLLRNNADPDIKDSDNRSAIEFAVSKGHVDVVKLLFGYTKMKINNRGVNKFTMLHIASQEGHLDVVKYLVEKGADVDAMNDFGHKPIHIAARDGHRNVVEFFFSIKMDINTLDQRGRTPLHFAAMNNQKEVAEYLINQKVDINICDDRGYSAVQYAVDCGGDETLAFLLNNGAAFDSSLLTIQGIFKYPSVKKILFAIRDLFDAVSCNNFEKCKDLIKRGVVINVVNKESFSPLHYASRSGYSEIVDILLKNNANVNIASIRGSTPLHFAAKFEKFGVVKLLLLNGAIFEARTEKNNRPVDVTKNQDIIKLLNLIEKLFMLVETHNKSLIKELKKIEVSDLKMVMNVRNKNNETLIVAATNNNFPEIKNLKFGLQNDFSRQMYKANKLSEQGRHSEALVIFEEIFEKQKVFLGPDNPGTLDIQLLIAQSNCLQNKYEEALNAYQEIYNKQIKILGLNNKDTLKTRSMMGLVLYKLDRNKEAIDIYQDAFEKQKELLDPLDENLLYTQSHVALVLMGLNRFDEALKVNYDVLKKYNMKFGKNNLGALVVQNNIAKSLAHLGKYEEALRTYQDVYQSRRKVLGPNHPDTLRVLLNKVEVFALQKNYDQAISSCKETLNIQKKALGPDHLDTLNSYCQLGHIFFDQCKFIDALKVYEDVYGRMQKVIGFNHPTVLILATRIKVITSVLESGGDFNLLKNIGRNNIF